MLETTWQVTVTTRCPHDQPAFLRHHAKPGNRQRADFLLHGPQPPLAAAPLSGVKKAISSRLPPKLAQLAWTLNETVVE